MRSHIATSKKGRGGRRYPPWVFTEHGVVMAATVLDSEKAVEASKFIVDVFVEVKNRFDQKNQVSSMKELQKNKIETSLDQFPGIIPGLGGKLQKALQHVLDSVIDINSNRTVREEAQNIINESIKHLKDKLKKQGLENEEIGARVAELLSRAEKEKAIAAKTRAETEALEFATILRKLRLLLEVQRAIELNQLDEFIGILREMSEN